MDSPKVVVAGASGFIGQAIGKALGEEVDLIGLSRRERPARGGYKTFRRADLFSLRDAEHALEGADQVIYLVHSMMPSARLVQGHFGDLDLLCADNVARAAASNNQAVVRGYKSNIDDGMEGTLAEGMAMEKERAYEYYRSMPADLFERMKSFKRDSRPPAREGGGAAPRARL